MFLKNIKNKNVESSISILFGVSYLILEYQIAGTGVSHSWYCLWNWLTFWRYANYIFEGILLPISYIMYMDKQLQIWGCIHTPHLRDCRVSMNCHQATKQWFVLTFWLLKSVGIFLKIATENERRVRSTDGKRSTWWVNTHSLAEWIPYSPK